MRACKRCKTNKAAKGLLNCKKCNEINKEHTAKLITDSKVKNLHIPVVSKSLDYGAFGGLGSELESGHMNYDAYHF